VRIHFAHLLSPDKESLIRLKSNVFRFAPLDFAIQGMGKLKEAFSAEEFFSRQRFKLSVLFTRLRWKPRSPDRGGMRVSSEAWAQEDWSFGGLRRTIGAVGSCPWGSTRRKFRSRG